MVKRKAAGQRRRPMKKARIMRRPRRSGGLVNIKRKAWRDPIVSQSNLPTKGSFVFELANLPNYTEFTQLFDQYRICAVKLQFLPRVTNQENLGGATQCPFHFAIDYTDGSPPVELKDILQYNNCRTVQALKPFNVYMKPRAAQVVWQGISANGYSPARRNTWLDSKSYGVPHYGFKYFFDTLSVGYTIDVMATYYLQFRGVN